MKQHGDVQKLARAERIYAWFLRLYPGAHQRLFGQQMLQTFQDHNREAIEKEGQSEWHFWLDVVSDECQSVVSEHAAAFRERILLRRSFTLFP
jgi:hypothetical protein